MKKLRLLRTAVLAAGIAIGLGSFASVASAATIITNWQDPIPYSFVSFGNPVIINGAYTLPPFWVGTIYVIQDGIQLPQELTINNSLGATEKSANFTIDLGIQPPLPSPHNIQLEFFGGTADYINGKEAGNPTNNADEYTLPRTYTASGSPDPVLSLSYDAAGTQPLSSPALNFANTVVNVSADRTIYVRNVGSGVATGVASVSSGENPFYCVPSCAYTIAAGAPAVPITIRYQPNIVNMTDNAMLNFSCTAANCNGINAAITGNSVQNPVLPKISLSWVTIDYGMQNINSFQDKVLIVTNNGGGLLTGSLNIPGSDFTCVANPSCSFSIAGGSNLPITIRFGPTTAGTKNVIAPETSNGGYNYNIVLNGWGNDKPLQDITCMGCASQYNWSVGAISIGSIVNADVNITNRGVGMATGYLDPTPGTWTTHGWSCTSVTEPDGSIVTPLLNQPCQYYGVTNGGNPAVAHMKYTALAPAGPLSDSVMFKSTSNLGNDNALSLNSSVILGQINIGVGYNFSIMDTLVNNSYHPVAPTALPIPFTNQGGIPILVELTLPTGAGVYTCKIENGAGVTTPCNLDIPNTLTFAGNETQIVTMYFAPTAPTLYTQKFTVCVLSDCVDYNMSSWGQDPRIKLVPFIPGSQDEDLWTVCATQYSTCVFSGTKKIYFGNEIASSSKTFTSSVYCGSSNFGDPTPGYLKKMCWYKNDDGGTWINAPWKTHMYYKVDNIGTGGVVEYNFISTPHFLCSSSLSKCSGSIISPPGSFGGNFAQDYDKIYFNPAAAGNVTETLTLQYNYRASSSAPTDCPGNVQNCHTWSAPSLIHTGTGIAGPHLTWSTYYFPTTNVGATSTTILRAINDGTDVANGVTVSHIDGPMGCVVCGPNNVAVGSSLWATISFTPVASGAAVGHFLISRNNDPTDPLALIATLNAVGNALAMISVTPGSPGFLDYGTVNEGSQAISGNGTIAPIIVTNTGAAPLSGDATITSGSTHYICVTCHYGPLNPGQSAEVKIAFVPADIGPLPGTVSFSGGGGATLSVFGIGQLGASSFSTTDSNFGRVLVKTGNYKEQVVTIVNNGTLAVPAGTISWTGTSGGMFTCVPPTPMDGTGKCMYPDIAPNGGTVSFTIRFTPTSPGSKKDTIKFSGSLNAKVSVIGIGVVPSVKFKEQ